MEHLFDPDPQKRYICASQSLPIPLQQRSTSERYDEIAAGRLNAMPKSGNREHKWKRCYMIIFPHIRDEDVPSPCEWFPSQHRENK